MITVISPAKKLDYESQVCTEEFTIPEGLDRSALLINKLQKTSNKKIGELMDLSQNLVELNAERYANWTEDFTEGETRQALLAFSGDVYQGMKNNELTASEVQFAQDHLRILSGLHGLLRPLDLIKPYRLEMGTKLSVRGKKDLYAFWGDEITNRLNTALEASGNNTLVNLASGEYFKAVNTKKLKGKIVTPVFKDMKNGQLKVIFLWAKQARGMMSGYILRNRINNAEDLKAFSDGGYRFTEELSDETTWVFTR
ncbi:MAG: peroxide stress protein YaaA [Flavobacteriales bacterium]|nr:peroxide stress protein YaaA [Flavobacteriales bacterium]MCB9191574.1 peroxide stress protein YaaA [Flavobacteriales bacterium]MCB9204389.1 peroxide stress protein YaaA [Flavobacteriales bacterium]